MNFDIPVDDWITALVEFLMDHAQGVFDIISDGLNWLTFGIEEILLLPPAWLLIALFSLLAWWRINWRFALFSLLALLLIPGMGLWQETMTTLALVIAATLVSLMLSIPLGIW
ncbi:MAG: hypothetical protein P8166_05405, partial [Candidatus Thiodiazotropha sp.]